MSKENYVESMVVDKNGNIYYSAKVINELDDKKDKEITRLHSIIKEVREYIEKNYPTSTINYQDDKYKLLEILDKINNDK